MADTPHHPESHPAAVDHYNTTYGRFDHAIYREIRRETWGEDIGQNGWITASEQDRFIELLSLAPKERLLDIACGSGGPTLRIAERAGAHVTGIDINARAIETARLQAAARGVAESATFQQVDAGAALPFGDGSFDVVICIDAINHLPDRPRVLAEWTRVLRPGGRLLYTDPVVVTGPLTNAEIAVRSSIGFFLFVAPDTNERMLAAAGLQLNFKQDLTDAMARTASNWHAARQARSADLKRTEGDTTFEGQQRFLEVAASIAREARLSRMAFLASKLT